MENGTALILRNILKKFKDDFNECKFAYIYHDIIKDWYGSVPALTELLFKNNINPFKLDSNLNAVPVRFAENISGIFPHKLTNDLFNNNVNTILPKAFFNCNDVYALDFKNMIIHNHAFCRCAQLETINLIYDTINIPNIEFGTSAFAECKNLKNATITFGKTSLHFRGDIFDGCDSLTEITLIGNGIVWLNDYDISNLKKHDKNKIKIKISTDLYNHSADFIIAITNNTNIFIEVI